MRNNKAYGKFKVARKYLKYYLKSSTKHEIHSPFVFEFINEVLSKQHHQKNKNIEKERKRLKASKQSIAFVDYGKNGNIFRRNVSEIAKNSLKHPKYARLIAQCIEYYKAHRVLEIGTSLGITTAYLASVKNTIITTLEGDTTVINLAKNVWGQLGLENIRSIAGNFDNTLDQVSNDEFDLIFLDGNHRYEPTLRYFGRLKSSSKKSTLIILDDIHYSKEMENAWNAIKEDADVTITMDLFFIGIVSLNTSYTKQNFVLKY